MADRNFVLRVRSSLIVLGVLAFCSIFFSAGLIAKTVLYLVALTATYEIGMLIYKLGGLFSKKQRWLAFCAVMLQIIGYLLLPLSNHIALLVTLISLCCYSSTRPASYKKIITLVFIPALIAILFSAFQYTLKHQADLTSSFFYSLLIIAVLSDMSGYILGKFFPGKCCQYPVSPRKTYHGFLGAFLLPLPIYYCLEAMSLPITLYPWHTMLFLTAAAIWGDLIFSLPKRLIGLKDYSAVLPGHGGVLDRIDSWVGVLFILLL